MLSGHVNRTQRPHTGLHRPSQQREDSPYQRGAVTRPRTIDDISSSIFLSDPRPESWKSSGDANSSCLWVVERPSTPGIDLKPRESSPPPSVGALLGLAAAKAPTAIALSIRNFCGEIFAMVDLCLKRTTHDREKRRVSRPGD
jgi:hypothetical protein